MLDQDLLYISKLLCTKDKTQLIRRQECLMQHKEWEDVWVEELVKAMETEE